MVREGNAHRLSPRARASGGDRSEGEPVGRAPSGECLRYNRRMATVAATHVRFTPPGKYLNLKEWLHELGDVPPERIVMDPWPGTATEKDLLVFGERDKRLVEVIH